MRVKNIISDFFKYGDTLMYRLTLYRQNADCFI